ncbi:MAG: methylcrotonoyl-CoA carboxylase, partial [Candidatus Eremiobacteraeota bacterium]|nr:methylcrotonoyl-CoA carboxylase [Candidatus Eremiobacteraeota bacterium]
MAVLESRLDRRSTDFETNAARMERLVAELRERLVAVRTGGGKEAVEKHRRRKKLTARERIERLIDPASDFLEFSPLAAFEMYSNGSPSAGILTGIGIVEDQHCVIVANDA